ncbi:MAG: cysteine--tRNA ligase [Candidatus Latescibacteria bacterium]|nr:cysteine--tRNA ligase [Candidatus Latescibacterota bacterium]
MALKVYNTLNRKKEEFVPIKDNHVNFYVCGPTVYDYFHIGNARPLIMFDVFRRYLEYRGYDVNYIVNITDIDDKIINRAEKEGVNFKVIARKFTDAFFDGAKKLGVMPATVHPRATDNIDGMLELVKKLIDKSHAYEVDGNVYFDISSFPGYGKLSGRDIEQMQSGARINVDERKNNPLDFALWKSAKPGEPSWDSPWGPGRPGWHIECSVMSMKHGNKTLDIHAGGQDLIFPHHENEIAQSEAANGVPFSKYWLHNGFLDIEGEKMSKSLGNFLTVKDILTKYDPIVIRIFFLLKHYRSPIDFSEERIKEAKAALDRLRNAYHKIEYVLNAADAEFTHDENSDNQIEAYKKGIEDAMDDDFNTARAMGHFFDIAKGINSLDEHDKNAFSYINAAKQIFDTLGTKVFGLTFDTQKKTDDLSNDLMNIIIEIRQNARAEKNWGLADLVRNRLQEIGIVLEDHTGGTSWKYI